MRLFAPDSGSANSISFFYNHDLAGTKKSQSSSSSNSSSSSEGKDGTESSDGGRPQGPNKPKGARPKAKGSGKAAPKRSLPQPLHPKGGQKKEDENPSWAQVVRGGQKPKK